MLAKDVLPGLGECSRQLSDQTGKRHIEGGIQIAGLWTRVVLEHFQGDGSVVGDDHAHLNHAQHKPVMRLVSPNVPDASITA